MKIQDLSQSSNYQVILADPPWSYEGDQAKWGAAAKFYKTMSLGQLSCLDIPLEKPGVLFLWATGPKLHIAIELLKSWGLHYRGVAFVWVKTSQSTGLPIGARGVRPSVVKPLTELVLVGSNMETGRPLKLSSESVVQTVLAPVGKHSEKPTEVHRRIEKLYPNFTKLEMFARGSGEPGWDVWGDESV